MKKHSLHRGRKAANATAGTQFESTISLSTKGWGYVRSIDSGSDIEIPPEKLNTALHNDRVIAIQSDRGKAGGRRYGEILQVISRSKTRFVGTAQNQEGAWLLFPDDRKCYTPFVLGNADDFTLAPNLKVAVDLVRWDSPTKLPKAKVVEVLGPAGEHETEMKAAVAAVGFDWHYPEDVVRRAHDIETKKQAIMEAEIPRRRDMRHATTFTIDPADAKDFDDAISIEQLPNGAIEIGVHIADVSAYVLKDDPIDMEAQKRATSIYLVDRTIPMLPEVLSNDVCSLNPNEDKLTFSAVFTIDPATHEVTDRWFGETVIRSDRRFAYEEAQAILDKKSGDLYTELALADRVAVAFRTKRMREGSIAFESDEVKFTLDARGWPIDVYLKQRQETNLMIEDLMLMANRAVSEYIAAKSTGNDSPYIFVWRVHDSPNPDKILELAIFLRALGYDFDPKDGVVTHKDINALFRALEGKPEKAMIETATIRSMAKAVYSLKNIGHFGLAFHYYTHFTSPIRRYPDLMVHRILKSHLSGKPITSREYAYYERLALHSSEREVAAAEAERASVKLKQVQLMSTHIGEIFEGVITGITDWGMFVEEKKSKAEGLIRLGALSGDTYRRGEGGFRLVGESTGGTYGLGDRVTVRLASVNIEERTIDWELVGTR
jgi:ribonuclease R